MVPEKGVHLLHELKKIQHVHGYLPEDALRAFSERARIPLHEIHGVATFYPHFRFEPRRKKEIAVCRDFVCKMADKKVPRPRGAVVKQVPCLGLCDVAPGYHVNDVPKIPPFKKPRGLQIDSGAPAPKLAPEKMIAELKESGLRGMGGAGFPTGVKWETVWKAPGDVKYVVCNADESEPGTFKDRFLLDAVPHLVLEGMMAAARLIGAKQTIVYIRHEYARQARALERAVKRAKLPIEVFVSAGGYICGEETALLEALEGKRAEPRNKPPFPATHGLWQKPTIINNVETFAWIPLILTKGGGWFKSQGINGAAGLKYLALSGDVERPGVYEVPLGIRVIDFIEKYGGGVKGGKKLLAYAPGGASSGFLPASMAELPLDFKPLADAGSMLGSGAVVVVAEGRDLAKLATNVVRFFRDESCGKCVPCRVGTQKAVAMLESGKASAPVLQEMGQTLALTSICGLGQAALNPILSVVKHFPDALH